MYAVGSDAFLTCNFISGSWRNENGSVVGNSQLDIPTANETIHNKTFSCSGLSRTTLERTSLRVAVFVTGKHSRLGIVSFLPASHVLTHVIRIPSSSTYISHRKCYVR